MAEFKMETGGRDDVSFDVSRCLYMRFSESSCRLCVDICPHGAITLDGSLSISPDQCHGCMLCTSVCPSGALEQKADFTDCNAQLSRVPEPVLGCTRTKEHSNATLACLGGLSEEHLVTLCHSLYGMLTLNMSACSECPNSAIIRLLRHRLDVLFTAGLLEEVGSIVMAESEQDIRYKDESVDRRSFFKSFRKSLFQSAAVILSSTNEPSERCTPYAAKRIPISRELLNKTRVTLPSELHEQFERHFDSNLSFSEACTQCQGCVSICPTGALQTEQSDEIPTFIKHYCTGCGLCGEFCTDGAIHIYRLRS